MRSRIAGGGSALSKIGDNGNVRSIVYDMYRMKLFQFCAGTESPGDSAGSDSGIGGRLHIHSGVSHI